MAAARVAWAPHLRLPGLRAGEQVRRIVLTRPTRAQILGADGRLLSANPATAALAGRPPSGKDRGTGLERLYDARLAGTPGAQLRFGDRVVATVKRHRGHSVHATIRPGLQRAAAAAPRQQAGGRGGRAPARRSVLALAGLAVSAPQPPGSTFKIITLSGALAAGVATPSSSFPVRTAATLSGVTLRNAGGESCGGSLTQAFIDSCNSVFAPARRQARRQAPGGDGRGLRVQRAAPRSPTPSRAPSRRRAS
jgi:cell division protein FtsI/penicillin-binding protein 2